MAEKITAQMEDIKQSIIKVEKDIDETEEILLGSQTENDKTFLRKKVEQLREKENLLRKEKEQLREQLRPAGMFSLKLHIPHINIAHHPLKPLFLIV